MIEGHADKIGADYFIIEKIDGKKYSAAKTTRKKAITK